MPEMKISFPGGRRVDAEYKGFTIRTDQSEKNGGENTAPAPFDLFLASLGTCSGFYVLSFCQKREIESGGIELTLNTERNEETGLISRVRILIRVPADFPPKYHEALIRAAGQCTVKKSLEYPPEFIVNVQARD